MATWAEVVFDSTIRWAIFLRIGDIASTETFAPAGKAMTGVAGAEPGGRRPERRGRRGDRATGAGGGAATAAGRGAGAGAGAAGAAGAGAPPASRKAVRSVFVTRPEMPVPGTCARSTPFSSAMFRTTGEERRFWRSSFVSPSWGGVVKWGAAGGAAGAGGGVTTRAAGAGAGAATGAGATATGGRSGRGRAAAAASAAGAVAVASPASPIFATTVLIGTVVPSWTRISRRTPADGAGISASTLSVEISKSGSSRLTLSPIFFIQRVRVPSAIDSPICGMITFVGMVRFSVSRSSGQ